MADSNEKLSPIMREKLAKIGVETPEEGKRRKDLEKLDSLLAEFYRGSLDSEELCQRLKEYEDAGKQFLLKEAKAKLEASFKWKGLPIKFKEGNDGDLTLELKEGVAQAEGELVLELNSSNLDEELKKHPLLVVDCWAPWCAPCRMVTPVIEELARDYQGKITFGKLNVDTNQSIAMKYEIMSIPTLLIFKDGQLVDEKVGALPRRMLEPELTKYFGEGGEVT
jgi:thioredoxin 1